MKAGETRRTRSESARNPGSFNVGVAIESTMENTMAVRAKVVCQAIGDQEVNFNTVYEEDSTISDENVRFTEATPWGVIQLGINNPAALEQFEVGKEYYVDFTPA